MLTYARTTINSLPFEITREILSLVDCEELFDLKFVCKHWHKIIKQLLDIKVLTTTDEIDEDAIRIFWEIDEIRDTYYNDTKFDVYRAPYRLENMINAQLITKLIEKHFAYDGLKDIDYNDVIREIAETAEQNDHITKIDAEENRENVRKTMFALTGLKYPLEKLKKPSLLELSQEGYYGDFAESLEQYEWFRYMTDSAGIPNGAFVALHPDKQTFAILNYPIFDSNPYPDYDPYSDDENHWHGFNDSDDRLYDDSDGSDGSY